MANERELWCAVILQALEDAVAPITTSHRASDREKTRQWLTGDDKDFHRVCQLADMDPAAVRKKALAVIAGQPLDAPRQPVSPEPAKKKRPKNSKIDFAGKSMTVKEWAQHLGLNYRTLASRLNTGWSTERALSTDLQSKRRPGSGKNFDQGSRDRRGHHAQDCAEIGKIP